MNLTPKQIVEQLNQYIIGQNEAKKAVAVALRNRYRRSKLAKDLRDEITPKNIIMKGPTGVGKTEIARRLAKLVKAPFIKIEATKYTEVGYVGRDVESMVRDLVETSVRMVKDEKQHEVEKKAKAVVDKNLIESIFKVEQAKKPEANADELKEQIKNEYMAGKFDGETIEVEIKDAPKPLDFAGGVTKNGFYALLYQSFYDNICA